MRFIDELEGLVSNQIGAIKTGLSMTKLEARLAYLSVFPLFINLGMLLICGLCSWLIAMGISGYLLMQAVDNVLIAMVCVFLFNLLVLGILYRYLLFNLKNMRFTKTRAYLGACNEPKKTSDHGAGKPGKTVDVSKGASQ